MLLLIQKIVRAIQGGYFLAATAKRVRSYFGVNILYVKSCKYDNSSFSNIVSECESPNWMISKDLEEEPRLNVILPSLNKEHLSGGPNTAINFCCRLVERGISLRFICVNTPLINTKVSLVEHFKLLCGGQIDSNKIEIVDGYKTNVEIGKNDIFLGTAWWTVHSFHSFLANMKIQRFFYLVQDYEPGFYSWGLKHMLALETYTYNHIPIVNSISLQRHLVLNHGNDGLIYNDEKKLLVFRPAVDSNFYFEKDVQKYKNKKVMLFYARPGIAERNLFDAGLEAFYRAHREGHFQKEDWEVYFIGENISDIQFETGFEIKCIKWMNFEKYRETIRKADLVLSLMLSPHPSYLPLEACACGAVVVTNTYSTKTKDYLLSISGNIVPVQPTLSGIKDGLVQASFKVKNLEDRQKFSEINLPRSWDEAFLPVVGEVAKLIHNNLDTSLSNTNKEYTCLK